MKHFIGTCIIASFLLAPTTSLAGNDDPYAFKVVKDGDLEMSCEALVEEAILMRDIIQTTEDIKSDARFNGHAVTAAAGLGSFIVGTVTGGIGLAAAGFLASQKAETNEQSAEDIQDIAHQRRALIKGIHKAKNCENSMDDAWIPIKTKSSLDVGNEKMAALEPAAGDELKNYNE